MLERTARDEMDGILLWVFCALSLRLIRNQPLCLPVGQVEDAQAKRGLGRPFIFSRNFLVILVVEHALSGVQPPPVAR